MLVFKVVAYGRHIRKILLDQHIAGTELLTVIRSGQSDQVHRPIDKVQADLDNFKHEAFRYRPELLADVIDAHGDLTMRRAHDLPAREGH